MRRATQVTMLIVLLFMTVELPSVADEWANVELQRHYEQIDRNGDGNLTRDESLDEWDTNKNGMATLEGVKDYYTKPRAGGGPAKLPAEPSPATPGALFHRIDIPGFSDIVEGTNGIAMADINHDGLLDIVGTDREPNRGLSNKGHHLRVFINQGNFHFQVHPITVRDSKLTCENFGPFPQIPNLVDFNSDGLIDIFITRHSPCWTGKRWPARSA